MREHRHATRTRCVFPAVTAGCEEGGVESVLGETGGSGKHKPTHAETEARPVMALGAEIQLVRNSQRVE